MLLAALLACHASDGTPVGATLDDGQILVGEVTTDTLTLVGELGRLSVPLDAVGMVVPVEGRTLADSHGHVTLWLRDGSEFAGAWDAPELQMAIAAGGRRVPVELPTDRLQALQLRADEQWPVDDRFRVQTLWGDDFLVDPTQTRLTLQGDFGAFELTLAECVYLEPVGAQTGPWRVQLATGTVLVGRLPERLTLVPALGPDAVSVPLTGLKRISHGSWTEPGESQYDESEQRPAPPRMAAPVAAAVAAEPEAQQLAEPGLDGSGGWFDNRRLSSSKR
ncbi:MAG: hypothetical protein R3F59_34280 [Myxococcota bacterium]